jgi:hypothetical protein
MLLSSSCHERTFDLDDIILHCYDPTFQKEGYDIKLIIKDYEELLVKEGVLEDGSGKSYLEVWQKIISNKDFRITSSTFQEHDPWHKVDKEIAVTVFECESEMIALARETDPRWHKVFPSSDSTEGKEDPKLMYQAMVGALDDNDLNSYYFRLKMFHLFDMVNSKWGNRSLMPTISTE